MRTALGWKSKIADLYTITLTLRRRFYTPHWFDIQYFLLFHPADNKQTEEVLLTGFSTWTMCLRLVPIIAPRHPARPAAFSITEVASTELLRPSSSSIDKHSWRPTSHWAVRGPQKTRPEALGRSRLFWETSYRANIPLCNYGKSAERKSAVRISALWREKQHFQHNTDFFSLKKGRWGKSAHV